MPGHKPVTYPFSGLECILYLLYCVHPYHSGQEYKDRLVFILMTKRSLHFRPDRCIKFGLYSLEFSLLYCGK